MLIWHTNLISLHGPSIRSSEDSFNFNENNVCNVSIFHPGIWILSSFQKNNVNYHSRKVIYYFFGIGCFSKRLRTERCFLYCLLFYHDFLFQLWAEILKSCFIHQLFVAFTSNPQTDSPLRGPNFTNKVTLLQGSFPQGCTVSDDDWRITVMAVYSAIQIYVTTSLNSYLDKPNDSFSW